VNRPAAPRAMVIVNGDDIHHDLISAALVFQQIGTEAGFATRRAAGTGRFTEPRPETAGNDVFVLYTSGGQFHPSQQEALAEMVAAGKGLVGIHCACIMGLPGDRALYELLGCRYLSHGPGHHEGRHTVEILGGHPVTEGLGPETDFELFDEYYEFELADDKVTVLAQRHRADGVVIPVMYAREVGAGRVVYLALGHDMRAWGEPSFRALVRQAMTWAAGL
jgi:uncharacterized protein